jgi:hypothetical protein
VDGYDEVTSNEMNNSSWLFLLYYIVVASQKLDRLRVTNLVAMHHGRCKDLFSGGVEGGARKFAYRLTFKTFKIIFALK